MDSFPQFTRSTLWRNLLEWGQLFSKEILFWAGDFPGAVFHGGNCPGGNFPREPLFRARFFSGAINPRRNCPGAIIQGEIVRGAIFLESHCSGCNFSLGQLTPGKIVRGQSSRGKLSGGQFSSGAIVRTSFSMYVLFMLFMYVTNHIISLIQPTFFWTCFSKVHPQGVA